MKKVLVLLAWLLVIFHPSVDGGCHRVELGPEGYHLKRTRPGGAHQEGWLWGGHLTYERKAPWSFYWGLDSYYACGCLDGKSSGGGTIASDVHEWEVEGRVGYSIQCRAFPQLTLFGGGGYFSVTNQFHKSKPMDIRLRDSCSFGSFGFLLEHPLSCQTTIGLTCIGKWMVEGKSRISNDPDHDTLTLCAGEKIHYIIEAPIRHLFCGRWSRFEGLLVPFYRFRRFGGQPNFPFDFVDTKWRSIGLRATLGYHF